MNRQFIHRWFVATFLIAGILAGCSNPSPTPAASAPIAASDLVGDWELFWKSSPKMPFYWLRLTDDSTFALTASKGIFDTRPLQKGSYALEGGEITFQASAGSEKCEGYSAKYKIVSNEDGTIALSAIDIPCKEWANMIEDLWRRVEQ